MVQRTEKNRFLQIKVALAFLFINVTLFAQNKGVVLDRESNAPLSGVNVSLNNKKVLSKTNNNGEFYLKRSYKFNPKDTLWFSYIGYSTKKIPATDIKATNNTVYLFKDTLSLKEITITSNKRPLDNSLKYTKLAPLKIGVSSFGSALVGNKIYVFEGNESAIKSITDEENILKSVTKLSYHIDWISFSNKLQVYDIPTDSWQISNESFRKRAFGNVIYYKDRLYILGGKNLSTSKRVEYLDNTIELYDMKQNKCFLDKTNPHPGVNCASFIYDSNLIVMGGSIKENEMHKIYSKKAHLQNLKTGLWYELPDMPTAKETKGIIIDNTIYLIGGFNDAALSSIECYNIKTGKWDTAGKLSYEVKRPAIACHDDIIYIFEFDKIQTFNIRTNEVKTYPIDLTLNDCELICYENMLYLIGGIEPNPEYSSASKNLYRIDINNFKKTETINQ